MKTHLTRLFPTLAALLLSVGAGSLNAQAVPDAGTVPNLKLADNKTFEACVQGAGPRVRSRSFSVIVGRGMSVENLRIQEQRGQAFDPDEWSVNFEAFTREEAAKGSPAEKIRISFKPKRVGQAFAALRLIVRRGAAGREQIFDLQGVGKDCSPPAPPPPVTPPASDPVVAPPGVPEICICLKFYYLPGRSRSIPYRRAR